MKKNLKKSSMYTLGIIFLMLFLVGIFHSNLVLAQPNQIDYGKQAGVAEISTDQLQVTITGAGQVPHFHFWDPNTNDVSYHVMFLMIFEAEDTNGDGSYDPDDDRMFAPPLTLPSSGWEMSDFAVTDEGAENEAIHFNMTQSSSFIPSFGDLYLQIRVHVYAADENELKFDLIVSGWDWNSDDSILVFQFVVGESPRDDEQNVSPPSDMSQEGNSFEFGNGYMKYAEEAKAGNVPIAVGGSQGETPADNGEVVYLAFENFGDATLEYDPTIGINLDSGEPSTTIGTPIVLFGVVFSALIGVVIIISKVKTRKLQK